MFDGTRLSSGIGRCVAKDHRRPCTVRGHALVARPRLANGLVASVPGDNVAGDQRRRRRTSGNGLRRSARFVIAPAVGWLCIALGILCVVARSVVLTNHFWIFATCAVPYVYLAGPVAVGAFAITKRWIALTIVVVLFSVLAAPGVKVAVTRPGAPSDPSVIVMTFNMRLGLANASQVIEQARSHKVELLMLQEMAPDALRRLRASGIGQEFAFSYVVPDQGGSGLGLFSRYPLTDTRTYSGFLNHVLSATVSLPDGERVTAFSSHLSAPWPQDASAWKVESARLGALLAATPGPVIDAGDFNATTSFRAFRNLVADGQVTDAATQAGAATLRTFPANSRRVPPLIGIDHVLVRGLRASSVDTLGITGSDHRAVLASVSVAGSPRPHE